MRDMAGYKATMLRIRSNILLTSLKDRWAAVFEETQVSHSCWLLIYLSCFAVFLFSITLWPSLANLSEISTPECQIVLNRWIDTVEMCSPTLCEMMLAPPWLAGEEFCKSRFYVDMHGNFRHPSDSTCPDSFFCIASPAPKKRNWVPTGKYPDICGIPQIHRKKKQWTKKTTKVLPSISIFLWYIREPENRFSSEVCLGLIGLMWGMFVSIVPSCSICFPETKAQFSCIKSRYFWTMFNLLILCLKSTNHQIMYGWNTSKSHWPQGFSMSSPIYMAEIPMTPGPAIGSPSLIGTRPTATGMASCAALPWVLPSCACGSISPGGAGMGFGKNTLEHHEKSRIIKVFFFMIFIRITSNNEVQVLEQSVWDGPVVVEWCATGDVDGTKLERDGLCFRLAGRSDGIWAEDEHHALWEKVWFAGCKCWSLFLAKRTE